MVPVLNRLCNQTIANKSDTIQQDITNILNEHLSEKKS